MSFRFRLDTVLRHRQREVDEKAREVARIERQVSTETAHLQELEALLSRAGDDGRTEYGERLQLGDLMAKTAWLTRVGECLAESRRRLTELKHGRDAARAELEESWRRCEALQRLRDRQKTEHDRGMARRNTREMDEIGSIRHALGHPA